MTASSLPSGQNNRWGTDADHVPVIPGNHFPSDSSRQKECPLQNPAPDEVDMGQAPFGQESDS